MAEARRILVTGRCRFRGGDAGPASGGEAGTRCESSTISRPVTRAHLEGVDVEMVEGDIRDAGAGRRAIAVEAVVHLAAAGSVVKSVEDPVTNFQVNVLGTFQVLDAARRAGVGHTVLASTGGALIGDAVPP